MSHLVLASGSPRRKELLEQIGVLFTVQSADIDETPLVGEKAADYVERLAEEKALAVLANNPEKVILAADTSVVLNGEILGKPDSQAHAVDMLQSLSGKHHKVMTGIAMVTKQNGQVSVQTQVVVTDVEFLSLSQAQIEEYVATGEPMDKAGAYGIQGKAAVFVKQIQGCYSNVVGLPLGQTGLMLNEFQIPVWQK